MIKEVTDSLLNLADTSIRGFSRIIYLILILVLCANIYFLRLDLNAERQEKSSLFLLIQEERRLINENKLRVFEEETLKQEIILQSLKNESHLKDLLQKIKGKIK